MSKSCVMYCLALFIVFTQMDAVIAHVSSEDCGLEDLISDHIIHIDIDFCIDCDLKNLDMRKGYDFEIQIDTDDTVSRIEFTTPQGCSESMIKDVRDYYRPDPNVAVFIRSDLDSESNVYSWEYQYETTERDKLVDHGDGEYQFTFYFEEGQVYETTVWFGSPGGVAPITEPVYDPNIMYPLENQVISSDLTVLWEPCVDPSVYGIEVFIENENYYFQRILIPSGNTRCERFPTQWEGIGLPEGNWYLEIDYSSGYFGINPDGIPLYISKFRKSGVNFTVSHQE